ncbi:MAG: hypothetical protein Q9195_006439 [Heterodermia aff. obscurata]
MAHGKLLGCVKRQHEVMVESDWCVVRKGWSRDLSVLISLFKKKLAQVSRKAAWSIWNDRQIQCMLKILLNYESAEMHNEGDLQAQLIEILDYLRGFEYLPEWKDLNKMIVKIEEANELHASS